VRHRAARAAAALLAAAALAAGCGQADGALTVRDAHVAPHPAGTGPAGGFLVIENGTARAFGPRDEVLRGVVKNHTEVLRKTGTDGAGA